jgi:hypothetical protein
MLDRHHFDTNLHPHPTLVEIDIRIRQNDADQIGFTTQKKCEKYFDFLQKETKILFVRGDGATGSEQ